MPFYKAAGEKLIEARDGNDLTGAAFYAWAKRTFSRSRETISTYMDLAEARGLASHKPFKSLNDFKRRHKGYSIPTVGKKIRDWTAPVDDIAEKAKGENRSNDTGSYIAALE